MGSTENIVIVKPGPPGVVVLLAPIVATARAFEVVDVESNRHALERMKALRAGEKQILDYFEPARKAADEAKKQILAARDGLVGPIAEARSIYDQKAATFERQEREKAEAEARRLQEEARKQEEERALLDAIAAEAEGDVAGAEQILEAPVSVPVVSVAPAVAKVEGVSSRTTWSAVVNDLYALVVFVSSNPQWLHLLEANQPNLNRLAVSQRQALSVPGVKAVATSVRSVR